MKDLTHSALLGDFISAFALDLHSVVRGGEYPCCPVVAQTKEHSTIVGRFTGEIGLPRVNEFKQALRGLIVGDIQKIIADFQDVTLTRTAVGALVAFVASVQGHNRRLYLYRPSKQVCDLLAELELLSFFSVLATEDDILVRLTV